MCQWDAGRFFSCWVFSITLEQWCPSSRWDAGGPQWPCDMCWKQFVKWPYASSRLQHRDSWGNVHHCQGRRNSVSLWQPCTLHFYSPVPLEVQKEVSMYPTLYSDALHTPPSRKWSPAVTDRVGWKALARLMKCLASVQYVCFLCMTHWQRRPGNLFSGACSKALITATNVYCYGNSSTKIFLSVLFGRGKKRWLKLDFVNTVNYYKFTLHAAVSAHVGWYVLNFSC